jgi:hypothetical protein
MNVTQLPHHFVMTAEHPSQQPARAARALKLDTLLAWPVCLYVQFTPGVKPGVSSTGESRGGLSVC